MAYPILAAKISWWAPTVSTVTQASVTEIEIMDSYTPDSSVTVVDSWDASAAKDGSITCYVIGTKLIIAGNGSGKIAANEDSHGAMFDFRSAVTISSIDLLDVSSAADMRMMFAYNYALTSLDLSGWNVSKVKNMRRMFFMPGGNSALSTLEISNWDVSQVTDMNGLFTGCTSITSLDLSSWNVSNVTDMANMFAVCNSLASVGDLSNWNVSSVTNMSGMCQQCISLISIGDLSNWNVSNVTNMEYMFLNNKKTTSLGDLSNWNVSNVVNTLQMFCGCEALASIGNISNWNTSKITSMSNMFSGCSKLTNIGDLSNWDTSNVTDMSFMFWSASSIKEINVSKWNVSKVANFDHFAAHAGLRRKGIENWKTTSATNMNAVFHNCAEEELDLSGWDVSKVQFFCQMFENSPNLKRIKGLEKWNTSAGLGFDGMFERCSKLEELDLSSFDTSKAKNGVDGSTNGHKTATLNNMFLSCNNLKKVKVGPKFSINGNGSNTTAANKAILPTPSTDYIEGADGMWYAFNGEPHAPNAIKDKTAETYFASYALCADQDIIVKNGSMIEAAKAIREKNGTTDHYTPAQFGAAIRVLN